MPSRDNASESSAVAMREHRGFSPASATSSSVTEGSPLTSLCSFSVCKVEMTAPASQAVVRITLINTFKCYNSTWHVASAALSVSYYYFRFEGND